MDEINWQTDDIFWAWLAGLLDGEGCFTLMRDPRPPRRIRTTVAVSLRIDDWRILKAVYDRAGIGNLRTTQAGLGARPNAHPVVTWQVSKIDECRAIIDGLDSVGGLRAKKARDYEIWREAVALTSQYGSGVHSEVAERLSFLKEEMHRTKKWDEDYARGAYDIPVNRRTAPRTGRSSSQHWASKAGVPGKLLRQRLYARLTQEQVDDILARVAVGERRAVLAEEYGVSIQLIGNFVRGERAKRDGTMEMLPKQETIAATSPDFWKSEAGQRAHKNQAILRGKLSQPQIDELVERYKNGESIHSLARAYEVSRPLVRKFIDGNYIRRD